MYIYCKVFFKVQECLYFPNLSISKFEFLINFTKIILVSHMIKLRRYNSMLYLLRKLRKFTISGMQNIEVRWNIRCIITIAETLASLGSARGSQNISIIQIYGALRARTKQNQFSTSFLNSAPFLPVIWHTISLLPKKLIWRACGRAVGVRCARNGIFLYLWIYFTDIINLF